MLQIGDTLISLEVLDEKFVCDLLKCKGQCCVDGDSGAPLEDDETVLLEKEYPKIKPFLREEGVDAIEKQGTWHNDSDDDKVTPLIKGRECAYTIFENGIAKCGIEKAYFEKKTTFRKPVSCHLYPIRIKKYPDYDALNYDRWYICRPACGNGRNLNVKVYEFVKEALIRKYGKEWYKELEIADRELSKVSVKK